MATVDMRKLPVGMGPAMAAVTNPLPGRDRLNEKRGVTVISRSDVEPDKGLFTCRVWRQGGSGQPPVRSMARRKAGRLVLRSR